MDPNKLASFNIPLDRVVKAVRESNNEVGGRVLEVSGYEQLIRGRGYVNSTEDLDKVVLKVDRGGVPVTLDQVATVQLGPAYELGQADLNGQGVTVGGIVVMRYGENALDVIVTEVRNIEEALGLLAEDASDEYATEIGAVREDVDQVRASTNAAIKSPTRDSLRQVGNDLRTVRMSVDTLVTAAGDTC